MDLGLNGKRAAVAAASTGLGFATAAALVEEGARVVICGRDAERIEAAADRLGDSAEALVADVSDDGAARRFVEQAAERLGGDRKSVV